MDWLDTLLKAGEVARQVRAKVPELVRPGTSLLEIAEQIENMIREYGGTPAFPCNISVDSVAAHYSPPPGDKTILGRNFVAKIDFGVMVDGFIADTAVTVTDTIVGEKLKTAVEDALKAAVKTVASGVRVSAVGAVVQNVLNKYGVKPIRNLTGHEIQRYNLHAGVSIPNISMGDGARLQEGHVYAIEPFATVQEGAGEVVDTKTTTIYRLERPPTTKSSNQEALLLRTIADRFQGLPYSLRWLRDLNPETLALHQKLVKTGRLKSYHVLVEKTDKPVAQAEHTVVVTKEGCAVVT
ncbi:MAG: type II methionyl aminopeptidase [Candidatus Caldarchaeum sp.]|nr:type II methionyl aminopeptidase [Candidatus Caldarchaeum sp.]MCX8201351.1 type II methionyl aminopeptidase [Candidatus Caldarchaeum sp.]MDW8063079.1 type II methionyl aminopeptidase [Candidatus Caldarchaeum sp.]MDW8434836.1 type II methionyl aminopeptidase [Candidatus Caldarchaeum sp.]